MGVKLTQVDKNKRDKKDTKEKAKKTKKDKAVLKKAASPAPSVRAGGVRVWVWVWVTVRVWVRILRPLHGHTYISMDLNALNMGKETERDTERQRERE